MKKDSNKTLVALCTFPISGCIGSRLAVTPFVTVEKWREYQKMFQKILMWRPLRREDIDQQDILAQATICLCKNHKGSRLKIFHVKTDSEWSIAYPQEEKGKVVKVPQGIM